jgi:cobalt-zinc-cadmium efflux system outer membrane protein
LPTLAAEVDGASTPEAAGAALDSLVAVALRQSPSLAAQAAGVEAARQEISVAGALPDPMVGLSAVGEDYPGAGIGTDPMAMTSLEVTQTLPWPGKRARRQAAAAARVPELAAAREEARRMLAADVREAYADLHASEAASRAIAVALAFLDILEPQAQARYETGAGELAPWLAVRREQATLASDLDREHAAALEARARLGAALADTSMAAAVDATTLPPRRDPSMSGEAGEFATITMADAAAQAAGLMRAAADVEGRPDFVLGAEYGWRDAMAPMVTARVGLEVPLWKGRKQDAMARAAAHGEHGALATARAARLQADAEARTLRARRDAADRAAVRLRERILPLLDLAVESARAGYLAGRSGADELVMALRERATMRAELAREEAMGYAADARLRALSGRDAVAGDGKDTR